MFHRIERVLQPRSVALGADCGPAALTRIPGVSPRSPRCRASSIPLSLAIDLGIISGLSFRIPGKLAAAFRRWPTDRPDQPSD